MNKQEIIKSKDNKQIKEAKKLLQKKYRTDSYLIEGFHLYEEARKSGALISQVFVLEEYAPDYPEAQVVTKEVLATISDSKTPQGLVAIVFKDKVLDRLSGKILVLDQVQDPGNVGTMIRTADAAGFDGVVLSKDSADIYSPKVMRSMQGSNFHLPILTRDLADFYEEEKNQGSQIFATTLSKNSQPYEDVLRNISENKSIIVIMGNEGQGISDLSKKYADVEIHIDMPGQAESLNVAVATGIILFTIIADRED